MPKNIAIVDQGRGLQLSTSRVTVQDLVPYFQEGCSVEEIIRWIPSLSAEEIAAVKQFYLAHREELDEQDRRIRQRSAERKNPPWVEQVASEARTERMDMLEKFSRSQANGEAWDRPAVSAVGLGLARRMF